MTTTLDILIAENRLIRGAWTGTDEHGRATACLLAALAPACGEAQDAAACPAEVMPRWFARLTPCINDCAVDARVEAVDRMTAAMLAAIEARCAMREAAQEIT